MKRHFLPASLFMLTLICVAGSIVATHAQAPPPPRSSASRARADASRSQQDNNNQVVVVEEPPPPVVINGKRAEELSEDEMIEFLQSKIQEIDQEEGQVKLLKIAPGYPLSLFFSETVQDTILGDPELIKISPTNRGLVLTAGARGGDTPMTLVFSGGRRLFYHIFIAQNFSNSMTSLKVNFIKTGPSAGRSGKLIMREGNLDVAYIANVIFNYDALKNEKALDAQAIKRFPVFRVSNVTPFTYYDLFRFSDGTIALTFSLRNETGRPVRVNESKLRFTLGNLEFIPDYASIDKLRLQPGEATKGFVVIIKPPFSTEQKFELNWR